MSGMGIEGPAFDAGRDENKNWYHHTRRSEIVALIEKPSVTYCDCGDIV